MVYQTIQINHDRIIFKLFSRFASHIDNHFNQCSIAAIVLNSITFTLIGCLL